MFADILALIRLGIARARRIPIIAATTKSSMSVKPLTCLFFE